MEQIFQDHSMIEGMAMREMRPMRRSVRRFLQLVLGLALCASSIVSWAKQSATSQAGISQAAAVSCDAKVKRLEAFEAAQNPALKQATQFSEDEWNSYLAIMLSPFYHPCLREIRLKFEESRLRADASIDFNRLNFNSTQMLNNLVRAMLTGVHSLAAVGSMVSGDGKARFQLEEARFDGIGLPNFLVVEILSAVGRKQQPPFDPTQPNDLPYHISRIELHSGFIIIHQQIRSVSAGKMPAIVSTGIP
jgi:hypothetical protein